MNILIRYYIILEHTYADLLHFKLYGVSNHPVKNLRWGVSYKNQRSPIFFKNEFFYGIKSNKRNPKFNTIAISVHYNDFSGFIFMVQGLDKFGLI